MFLCKYNTAITATTPQSIKIPIVRRGVVDYAVGADWTPAAGDVKLSKDGGAAANITTLPTAVTMGNTAYWEFVFSGAELSCGQLTVTISDSATKVIEDQFFLIRTFGNASAFYQWDMTAANLPSNVTQLLGTAWLTPGTPGTPDMNAKYVGGFLQTAGDIYSYLTTNVGAFGANLTALPALVWNALSSGLTTANSIGKRIIDYLTGDIYAIVNSGSYGNAALLTAIQNVQNGTFVSSTIPQMLERPDAGSTSISIAVVFADETGAAKNLDSGNPTATLVNDAGTDLSSRLGVWANPATGKYTITYTNTSTDAIEGLHWDITGTVNSKARRYVAFTQIVDTTAVSFTSTDRTNLGTILTQANKLTFDGSNYIKSDPQTLANAGDLNATQKASVTAAVPTIAGIAAQITTDHGSGSYVRNTEPDNTNIVVAATQSTAAASSAASAVTGIAAIPAALFVDGGTNKLKVNTDHSVNSNATVDSTAIANAVIAGLGAGSVTVVSPINAAGTKLTIVQGDDYLNADGRAIAFTITGTYPDWTGAAATLRLKPDDGTATTVAGTIVTPTGSTRSVRFDLTHAVTSLLAYGQGKFQVSVADVDSHVMTPVATGLLVVSENVAIS